MEREIVKPSILPGFMELNPKEQIVFNNMMDIIRRNYEKFGFLPIDTPAIEKSEVLLAKGGGETEKQIYKVVKGSADMSLRFDLTVPLARYVVQHFSELTFPFRRYHIAKVYRGERNQKGRYREFYQADIDIIGNGTLDIVNDAEIPAVIYSVFKDLKLGKFTIMINNRRLLSGYFESIGIIDQQIVLRAIDKIDKIGKENVIKDLKENNLTDEQIKKVLELITLKGSNSEKLQILKGYNINNEMFVKGLDELNSVVKYLRLFGVEEEYFSIDLKITRGLDYYTGTVYETFIDGYESIGSVCSGGRYDNLAEFYTKNSLPGVGISIGLTRLFYQLLEAGIVSIDDSSIVRVMIIPMKGFMEEAAKLAAALRQKGISTSVFLENTKLSKKFNYADKLGIPYTIAIGEEEKTSKKFTLKNMKSGDQKLLDVNEIIKLLSI